MSGILVGGRGATTNPDGGACLVASQCMGIRGSKVLKKLPDPAWMICSSPSAPELIYKRLQTDGVATWLIALSADTAFEHRAIKIAYTVAEAVFVSGLSRSSLYISIGKGALRTKKCGRRTVILHEDLVNFLQTLPNSIY